MMYKSIHTTEDGTGAFTIWADCPLCGQRHEMELTHDESIGLVDWEQGLGLIQDTLHMLNPAEREFVKTGFCPSCQEMMFCSGITSARIRPVD